MVEQLAVFLENRKGRLLEMTKVLKEHGIDLLTLSIADTSDFGILRIITRDNERALKVLKSHGFTVTANNLIGVEVDDRPGGLSEVLELLDSNDISVEYLYSFAHTLNEQGGKRGIMLFRVENEKKALKILKENDIRILNGNFNEY